MYQCCYIHDISKYTYKYMYVYDYLFLMQVPQSFKRTKPIASFVPQNPPRKHFRGMMGTFLLRKWICWVFLRMLCIFGFGQQVEDVQMKDDTVFASDLHVDLVVNLRIEPFYHKTVPRNGRELSQKDVQKTVNATMNVKDCKRPFRGFWAGTAYTCIHIRDGHDV